MPAGTISRDPQSISYGLQKSPRAGFWSPIHLLQPTNHQAQDSQYFVKWSISKDDMIDNCH